jgi:hypothetical protein
VAATRIRAYGNRTGFAEGNADGKAEQKAVPAVRRRNSSTFPSSPDAWEGLQVEPKNVPSPVGQSSVVAAAVRFADRNDLDVAVQLTGHWAWARERPTLLIHTGRFDELSVEPTGRARGGAGVQWQQVLDAAAPYGFGALAGSAPHVGVVGYLTGGWALAGRPDVRLRL